MTTTTDTLDSSTDAQLNELFAVEVAGWTMIRRTVRGAGAPEREPSPYGFPPGKNYEASVTSFTTDANAVLPWLEGAKAYTDINRNPFNGVYTVSLLNTKLVKATAPTFARAAVIALIRARRAGKQ